jgi:hypothetical protein
MVADRLSAALGLAKPRSGQIFKDYEGTEAFAGGCLSTVRYPVLMTVFWRPVIER